MTDAIHQDIRTDFSSAIGSFQAHFTQEDRLLDNAVGFTALQRRKETLTRRKKKSTKSDSTADDN